MEAGKQWVEQAKKRGVKVPSFRCISNRGASSAHSAARIRQCASMDSDRLIHLSCVKSDGGGSSGIVPIDVEIGGAALLALSR